MAGFATKVLARNYPADVDVRIAILGINIAQVDLAIVQIEVHVRYVAILRTGARRKLSFFVLNTETLLKRIAFELSRPSREFFWGITAPLNKDK